MITTGIKWLRTKLARQERPEEQFSNGLFRRTEDREVHDEPPVVDEPHSCPRCNSKISVVGESYECIGLHSRQEVEEYLAPCFPGGVAPAGVVDKAACGWSGRVDEFGSVWR